MLTRLPKCFKWTTKRTIHPFCDRTTMHSHCICGNSCTLCTSKRNKSDSHWQTCSAISIVSFIHPSFFLVSGWIHDQINIRQRMPSLLLLPDSFLSFHPCTHRIAFQKICFRITQRQNQTDESSLIGLYIAFSPDSNNLYASNNFRHIQNFQHPDDTKFDRRDNGWIKRNPSVFLVTLVSL